MGPLAIISVAKTDPFPDELLPPLWSAEAKAMLESAPTDAQRRALSADRRTLQALFRALQRRIRLVAPASLLRAGLQKERDEWVSLGEEALDACLQPLTSSTNNALATGRTPRVPLESHAVVSQARSRLSTTIRGQLEAQKSSALNRVQGELVSFAYQVIEYFQAEIRNRDLTLERRRQAPPEAGPIELWQGQVAALDRALATARLNYSEATKFLQHLSGGSQLYGSTQPVTLLMALIFDD
jgi:ATP-dependent helicase HepA